MKKHTLYWLAGLLEGEGAFMKGSPSKPKAPQICLQMTDEDIVARVAHLCGVSYQKRAPSKRWWKTIFSLFLRGARAVKLMKELKPLLGLRRRAQIKQALLCYKPDPNHWTVKGRVSSVRARTLVANGLSYRAAARKLKCSHQTILRHCKGL
jgi:hypothetical protein